MPASIPLIGSCGMGDSQDRLVVMDTLLADQGAWKQLPATGDRLNHDSICT